MPMLRFSESFTPGGSFAPAAGVVTFLPASRATTADGGATVTYPTPYSAGYSVSANLQRDDGDRKVIGQTERYETAKVGVCLLDDPAGLPGGNGCRRQDAFWWSGDPGRLMIAQEDASKEGSVWRVRCRFDQ